MSIFVVTKIMIMESKAKIVRAGECCLCPQCALYGRVGLGNIRKNGHTKQNRQRYHCRACGKTYSERTGSVFYGLRTDEDKVVQTLTALARGSRIGAAAEVQGIKEETVTKWLKRAGRHAEELEEILFKGHDIGPSEIDGLWSYVRHKGEKKRP